jgi:N-methylhydantoinase A
VPVEDVGAIDVETFARAFAAEHRKTFGYDIPGRAVEVVNVRLKVVGEVDKPQLLQEAGAGAAAEPVARRPVYFGAARGWMEASVYNRPDLGVEATLVGPAIIEEMSGTTVLPPDCRMDVDRLGNLIIGV